MVARRTRRITKKTDETEEEINNEPVEVAAPVPSPSKKVKMQAGAVMMADQETPDLEKTEEPEKSNQKQVHNKPINHNWNVLKQRLNTKEAKTLFFSYMDSSTADENKCITITLAINANVWSQTVKQSDHKLAKRCIAEACLLHYNIQDVDKIDVLMFSNAFTGSTLLKNWLNEQVSFSIIRNCIANEPAENNETSEKNNETEEKKRNPSQQERRNFIVSLRVNENKVSEIEDRIAHSIQDVIAIREAMALEYLGSAENIGTFISFLTNKQNQAMCRQNNGWTNLNGNGNANNQEMMLNGHAGAMQDTGEFRKIQNNSTFEIYDFDKINHVYSNPVGDLHSYAQKNSKKVEYSCTMVALTEGKKQMTNQAEISVELEGQTENLKLTAVGASKKNAKINVSIAALIYLEQNGTEIKKSGQKTDGQGVAPISSTEQNPTGNVSSVDSEVQKNSSIVNCYASMLNEKIQYDVTEEENTNDEPTKNKQKVVYKTTFTLNDITATGVENSKKSSKSTAVKNFIEEYSKTNKIDLEDFVNEERKKKRLENRKRKLETKSEEIAEA